MMERSAIRPTSERGSERRSGKQARFTLGSGRMTDSTEREDSSTKMGSTMRVISLMIKLMGKESITTLMALFTRELSLLGDRMGAGMRRTLMGLTSKASLMTDRR